MNLYYEFHCKGVWDKKEDTWSFKDQEGTLFI